MQEFAQWSLDTLREEGASLSWLEENRFDWATSTSLALEQILDGKTIILITDEKRKWLESYILSNINASNPQRPLLPIISIDGIFSHYNKVNTGEMIDMMDDMISLSYKDNYFFWYIGCGDDKRCDIAKRQDNSYFWMFDEEYSNSFMLRSYDKNLDIKLLQIFRQFDLSVNAALFGEVDVTS